MLLLHGVDGVAAAAAAAAAAVIISSVASISLDIYLFGRLPISKPLFHTGSSPVDSIPLERGCRPRPSFFICVTSAELSRNRLHLPTTVDLLLGFE